MDFSFSADVSRTVTEGYKIWLAGGATLLALYWARLPRKWSIQLLVVLLSLSAMNYARWGTEAATQRLDAYDLLHYYVNAKYFDEIGYLDLYPAVLLVDHENDGPFFEQGDQYLAQDDEGHHLETIGHALGRGEQVRSERFTEERWAQFEHDVLYLQRTIGCRKRNSKGRCVQEINDRLWRQLINDHGFNGTTAWTAIARPIASIVPVESLKLLGYLDVLLLSAAIGAVVWAYGTVPALWTALFLLTTYSTRWPYFSWVFLRYDWVAGLLLATAMLKRGKPLLAGLFAGWTAVLRMFPAMWMWGPLGKGLAGLVRGKVHRQLLVFAAGFLLSAGVIQAGATVSLGVDHVQTHFHNMIDHNDPMQLSSRRIGLALALSSTPWRGTAVNKIITTDQKRRIEAQKPLRYGLAALILLALAWGLRHSRDDEAYAFGFLPFYLITTASYYYYVARATLILVHAADLHRLRNRVGLASLFAMEAFCNWAQSTFSDHRLFLIGTLSWLIAAYILLQVGWLLWEAQATDSGAAPAQGGAARAD